MRIQYEGKYFKYSLYTFFVIAASIIFYKTLDNFTQIYAFLLSIFYLLMPFIIGFVIAYLFNPPMTWLEGHVLKYIKRKARHSKRRRFLSILLVYIIFFGLATWVGTSVVPKVISSTSDLINRIPEYSIKLGNFFAQFSDQYPFITSKWAMEFFNNNIHNNIDKFLSRYDYQNIEVFISGIMKGVVNLTTLLLDFILGCIIGFYFLMEKELIGEGLKRFLRALLKDRTVRVLIDFGKEVDHIFSKFIIGKAIDSIIIGILCFIGLLILNIKYASIISLIIGITNMIPYFGPFIGAVPAIIITLFDSPVKAIWVGIFIFILQQFDGMVLGPKILGDSIGLSPVWIIFAIIIGGGFFGVIGMFLGVPMIAVVRLVLVRFIDKKIKEKETLIN